MGTLVSSRNAALSPSATWERRTCWRISSPRRSRWTTSHVTLPSWYTKCVYERAAASGMLRSRGRVKNTLNNMLLLFSNYIPWLSALGHPLLHYARHRRRLPKDRWCCHSDTLPHHDVCARTADRWRIPLRATRALHRVAPAHVRVCDTVCMCVCVC